MHNVCISKYLCLSVWIPAIILNTSGFIVVDGINLLKGL